MTIDCSTINSGFAEKVQAESGVNIFSCYQCGKCTAGCPMANDMTNSPNKIIRMVQLGMKREVLSSDTIWLCASCLTCSARCPREIEIAEVMDVLRRIAYRENILPEDSKDIPLFNRIFLRTIELFGRSYEVVMIGTFNILTGNLFKDFAIVPRMFLKGKISLFPATSKGATKIFRNSRRIE
jgi:heterodisulfide reductase subunit C